MKNDPIHATWCLSNNVGDTLTSYLIEKITGQLPIYVEPHLRTPKVMVTGSILNHAVDFTTVWGAGLADFQHDAPPSACYTAVRGPHTARRCRIQAERSSPALGDPALLMPRFFDPRNPDGSRLLDYSVGICPHYIHQAEAFEWARGIKDVKVLNVLQSPEDFVSDMLACEVIYSSSLHGLIFADAYGIPSQWIDGTAKLGGDGMKFLDHLIIRDFLDREDPAQGLAELLEISKNVNIPLTRTFRRLHIQELPRDADALRGAIIETPPPDFTLVTDALWHACPFRPEEVEE